MEKKEAIYPVEPWSVTETEFNREHTYRNETTFALSNGYIGTRGTFEEGYELTEEEGLEGNFINGFYESEDIRYGEWNYGFPLKSQSLLNVCNGKIVKIYLEEEEFHMETGELEDYRRTLDMKSGYVVRSLDWTSPKGRKIHLETERLVSFADKNCMALRIRLTPLNFNGEISMKSVLDGDVENHTRTTNPLVDYGPFGRRLVPDALEVEAEVAYYEGTATKSGLSMACGTLHNADSMDNEKDEYRISQSYSFYGEKGKELVFDKFIVYTTSLDMEKAGMRRFVRDKLVKIHATGYESLKSRQKEYMAAFWKNADVEIYGDEALLQGIRFNLFHIMQAAGRDGCTGMGAKGLSGEGYEGHYFWDTEIYMLPVFIYTNPPLAVKLLDYRFHTLDQARARARVLGHDKGALYPWRTINGEEASTYFPLGTAQYHINGDIAYAFWQYVTVTGDMEYLRDRAAEVLCETARVWADVGCFAECRNNQYCICSVTGPDEYNAIVDNNFYTNLMARENLRNALEALCLLAEYDGEAYDGLKKKLGLLEAETEYWQRIVDNMYFPYDEKLAVYLQDDGFMMRKPWDDSKIPPEKRHLLYENYHPLFIYRQRMSKQADAILGMYLHSNLFKEEELRRNYDFYQQVTLHHSSLSTCIFGILACEIGYYDEAYAYFTQSARMDLDDYHDNFYAGIHAANMAGTWQAIVNGFGGLRTNDGKLRFKPYLPDAWEGYRFRVCFRGCIVQLSVREGEAEFFLAEGKALVLYVGSQKICLEENGKAVVSI